ncbi:unnamed protein product [Caenorhabditis auriculariae]|uniref:arginine kinase n=1 Tax=Caenorhabditis auriculariae TaxID=2777116 RepID=A0A8S1HI34_9PELO|nr:unnamed protein product [Caenorhabditis auriculariae]
MTASPDVVKKIEEGYAKLQAAADCKSLLKKHLSKPVVDKLKALACMLRTQSRTPCLRIYSTLLSKNTTMASRLRIPNHPWTLERRILETCLTSIPKTSTLFQRAFEPNYKAMEARMKAIFSSITDPDLKGTYYPLTGMDEETKKKLVADHFLFKEGDRFLKAANANRFWPTGRGIFHNEKKTFLVWVNEEDHLRIISMQPGGNVGEVLGRLIKGINLIAAKTQFARHQRLGWLTFCPTNLGTTVRASAHIKLPKVSAKPEFQQICNEMKLQIRGIHGEHSESADGIYDISNKQRLGLTEYEAVRQMYEGLKKLIELEKAAEAAPA